MDSPENNLFKLVPQLDAPKLQGLMDINLDDLVPSSDPLYEEEDIKIINAIKMFINCTKNQIRKEIKNGL